MMDRHEKRLICGCRGVKLFSSRGKKSCREKYLERWRSEDVGVRMFEGALLAMVFCWRRSFAGDGALLAKVSLDVIHIRIELTVNVNAPALFNQHLSRYFSRQDFCSLARKKFLLLDNRKSPAFHACPSPWKRVLTLTVNSMRKFPVL